MRPFKTEDFETYRSWFDDVDLNRTLGPMDAEWLEHVLGEDPPRQFSFFENGKLIAVIGIEGPEPGKTAWYVTDIAVDPLRKRDGIGRRVIKLLLETHRQLEDCPDSWITFVDATNHPALQFFETLGWTRSQNVDKENLFQFHLDMKSCIDPSL